jgi:leader peptidase (prepilin peptidase)/N-methyltransferase
MPAAGEQPHRDAAEPERVGCDTTGAPAGRVSMELTTAALAGGLGVLAGPWLRGLIFAHSVAWQQPLRARCPGCGTDIVAPGRWGLAVAAPIDGKCPCCRTTIGPPTATVEIVAAAVLVALSLRAPADRPWVVAAWVWLALLGIPLAGIDIGVHRLPDPLTTAATSGVLVLLVVDAIETGDVGGLLRGVACSAGLGAGYLIAVLTPAGMGRGDAHLAISLGLVCGQISVPTVWVATLATIALAGGYVALGRLTRTLRPHDQVALGPFMLAGTLAAVLTS